MIKTLSLIFGSMVAWWIVVAIAKGASVAWLVVGSIGLTYLLIFYGVKLYGDYFSWRFERRFNRMSQEERDTEVDKAILEVHSMLKEDCEEPKKD